MGDIDQEDRAELERLVGAAMEVARGRTGLDREAWARRLRPALHLPPAMPDQKLRNNWYAWRAKPWSIPAVALLAASRVAEISLDALLSSAAQRLAEEDRREGPQPVTAEPSAEGRLARLEREVAEQQRIIDELVHELDRRSAGSSSADQQRHRSPS